MPGQPVRLQFLDKKAMLVAACAGSWRATQLSHFPDMAGE